MMMRAMVAEGGLEPPRREALDFESSVSTNSTTLPWLVPFPYPSFRFGEALASVLTFYPLCSVGLPVLGAADSSIMQRLLNPSRGHLAYAPISKERICNAY